MENLVKGLKVKYDEEILAFEQKQSSLKVIIAKEEAIRRTLNEVITSKALAGLIPKSVASFIGELVAEETATLSKML